KTCALPIYAEPAGRLFTPAGDQDAVALPRAPPGPAPELMELREAESLRMLDEHDRGVGDVDPDLDHGRGHEDVQLARHERAHRGVLLLPRHLPVHEPDAEVGEDRVRQP